MQIAPAGDTIARITSEQGVPAELRHLRTAAKCLRFVSKDGTSMGMYQRGDYIKVEFKDETDEIGEWMWVRVDSSDDGSRLVFGTLDNEPVVESGGKLKLGSQLAISYDKIREHKKPSEFARQ